MDTNLLDKLDHMGDPVPRDICLDLPSFDQSQPVSLSSIQSDLLKNTPLSEPAATSAGNTPLVENEYAQTALTAKRAGEIELKIKQAYEAGLTAGRKESALEDSSFADSIGAMLASLDQSAMAIRTDITEQQNALAVNILRKLLPASMKTQAGAEVIALVTSLLDKAAYGTVDIHIPPQMTASFTREMGPYKDRIRLFENSALKAGMSRLEWQGGGADIDLTSVTDLCLQCLGRAPSDQPDATAAKAQETV